MQQMPDNVENQITVLNRAIQNHSMLMLRLDPSNVIEQIKMFLNAEIEMVVDDGNGNFSRKVIAVGVPKANKKGVASILNWVQVVINPQVVQGNFPKDKHGKSEMYDQFIMEFQKDLGDMLYINLYDYDINENEVQSIIDAIMNLVKPFMTRLIDNKERESYGDTLRQIETVTQGNKQGFSLWKN